MRQNIQGVIGELTSLPGCSQIVVSHGVFVPEKERGKGLGKSANLKRTEMAKAELGYDYMICTVCDENKPQHKILLANGWEYLDSFSSSRTNHLIHIMGKKL